MSSPDKVYENSIESRLERVIDEEVKSYKQGDRQRDWRTSYRLGERVVASLCFPAYEAQLSYKEQKYEVWIAGVKDGLRLGSELPTDRKLE